MSGIGSENAGVALGSIGAGPRRGRRIAAGTAVVALALAGAAGGYLVGGEGGTDLDSARAQGAEAGEAAGIQEGGRRGYELGYDWAERVAFEKHYADEYREAYAEAFADAGLDAPELADIEVTEP